MVTTLTMETSDHVPCLISVDTMIPKGGTFKFENYLMEHEHFLDVVNHAWMVSSNSTDRYGKGDSATFKNLRRVIKSWQVHLSSLKENIANVKLILVLLNILEEFRDLTIFEWNFKKILEAKFLFLLKQHRIYWKQHCTIKWIICGDAGTKFFHANATIRQGKNLITSLIDTNGNQQSDHHLKAAIL